jgi:hypothetical protein
MLLADMVIWLKLFDPVFVCVRIRYHKCQQAQHVSLVQCGAHTPP